MTGMQAAPPRKVTRQQMQMMALAKQHGVSVNYIAAGQGLMFMRHRANATDEVMQVCDGFIARGMEVGVIEERHGFEPGEIDTNWLASRAVARELRKSNTQPIRTKSGIEIAVHGKGRKSRMGD